MKQQTLVVFEQIPRVREDDAVAHLARGARRAVVLARQVGEVGVGAGGAGVVVGGGRRRRACAGAGRGPLLGRPHPARRRPHAPADRRRRGHPRIHDDRRRPGEPQEPGLGDSRDRANVS